MPKGSDKKTYEKVAVPNFSDVDDESNTCPFFRACFYMVVTLIGHQITRYHTLDELWEIVTGVWKADPYSDKPSEEDHNAYYNIMKEIDPELYCWYNYLLIFHFHEDLNREGPTISKQEMKKSQYK
jgi:hypothetical protein